MKRSALFAVLIILAILVTVSGATFAWYIYNTHAHTTNVHMAAGTGSNLQISNRYDGDYGSTAVLDAFTGLLNPVSTDRIGGGFQKVYGFMEGSGNQPNLIANLFGASDANDYYKTSLFLKNNGGKMQIYVSEIGYEDDDSRNPISTAIRVGITAHEPGRDRPIAEEFIFSINEERNEKGQYNTYTGQDGYVLQSSKTDGTTVRFSPYTSANFCNYNNDTGEATLKPDSVSICSVSGDGQGNYGEIVQVDVYIWLEGCDADCANNLCDRTLKNISISFAGISE